MADLELYCPKCGERVTHTPTDANLRTPYICIKCGIVKPYGEFKTPTGETLIEHANDIPRDTHTGI
jgi:DNA-directed RNA polymerase subunit RPC12/RpoP